MNDLETLIATALIGTERQALPELSLAPGLNAETKEANLLSAAALLTAYRHAGYAPQPTRPDFKTLEPSPSDTRPAMTNKMRDILRRTLQEHPTLLEECLTLFRTHRFAHRDLPMMLEHGRGNTDIRANIAELLDARGRWLAGSNPQWSWATSNTESLEDAVQSFETGSRAARALALQAIRAQDPERARTLLEGTWKKDSANERKDFISVLKTKLSSTDEAFLENALTDRSADVRELAAQLLASLPESQFNARALERLKPILIVKKDKLHIELPETFDPAWSKDGIEEKAQQGFGERYHWVHQMLQKANLEMVQKITGFNAFDLLTKTHEDWQGYLKNIVTKAAQDRPNRALVEHILAHDVRLVPHNALGCLEPNRLEQLVIEHDLTTNNNRTLMLQACTHTWSEYFFTAVLEHCAKQMYRIQEGSLKDSLVLTPIIQGAALELIPRVLHGHPSIPTWTAMLTHHTSPPGSATVQPWYWTNAQHQFQNLLAALQLKLEMHTTAKENR